MGMQERHRKAVREQFLEQQRQEEEQQRQEEEEKQRSEAEEEARASAAVLAAMPAPVTADEVMMQAAVQVEPDRKQAAVATKVETEDERMDREKKKKALAWLLEYQKKQAE